MDNIIKQRVLEHIKGNKMFTSVDIANCIKREGIWVRNVVVRNWLQNNFNDKSIFDSYAISQITVCNNSSLASLYHPFLSDPKDYTDTDQKPLTPDEVKEIYKNKVGTPRADAIPDITDILTQKVEDDTDLSIVISSVNRIKIPGMIIRKLGWKPGDLIDPSLILTHKVLPNNLRMNSDYRVSIPRSSVNWGVNPVIVMLKNGKVVFEKTHD